MSLGIGSLVSVGGGSGGSSGSSSGIQTINPGGNVGPDVLFQGVNGIEVTSPSTNIILIDGAGASGVSSSATKFATDFSGVSGLITHSLGSLDILVQIYDRNTGGARQVIPDDIIVENLNQVSIIFNQAVTDYRVVII